MNARLTRRILRGFTLIELLVVVSIIALLISILLPSLRSARDQAKASVCLANMKRLGTGIALYLNESRDKLPPFRLKNHPLEPSPEEYVNEYGRRKPRWQWFIAGATGPVISPLPFDGPFGDSDIGEGGQSGRRMTNNYFLCPSLHGEHEFDIRNGAYGYNYQYLGNSRTDTLGTSYDNFPVGADRLRAASQTVLFADSRGAGPRHGKHSYTLDPPRLATEANATHFGPGESDVSDGADPLLYAYSPAETRHQKRAMVAYLDSHAEPMRLADLGYGLEGGMAVPTDPQSARSMLATNRLWNGRGYDEIADGSEE